MAGDVSINVPVQPGFDSTFRSRNGLIGKDLSSRSTRVQLAAKAQVGVRTGMLKRDITKNWISGVSGDLAIRVGSARRYAEWHHEGTRPHVIRPKHAKVLRWTNKQGKSVFARVVHHPGTKPNRYLTDNLHFAVR